MLFKDYINIANSCKITLINFKNAAMIILIKWVITFIYFFIKQYAKYGQKFIFLEYINFIFQMNMKLQLNGFDPNINGWASIIHTTSIMYIHIFTAIK